MKDNYVNDATIFINENIYESEYLFDKINFHHYPDLDTLFEFNRSTKYDLFKYKTNDIMDCSNFEIKQIHNGMGYGLFAKIFIP